MTKKIFMIAGEVSGDVNASHLARAMLRLDPSLEFVGIGGGNMRDAGVRLLADSTTWGSIGFFEGFVKGLVIYPVARRLKAMFESEKPDLFIPVDYRVFNMRAARIAKSLGIPVVYFFAPVSWFGSGGKRFQALAETVDLSLLALPMSLDDYKAAGARHEYIGHPLVDAAKPSMTREQAREFFGVEPDAPLVGLMPGSRGQEVKRLMPVFARSAEIVAARVPGARFIAFRAAPQLDAVMRKHIRNAPVDVASERVYDFMNACDVLALCSGTATHEAALMGKPMIISYKLHPVTAWIARRTVNPPMIGLPNIIAGEFVAPELVQEECVPERVAEKIIEILSSQEIRDRMTAQIKLVAAKLGSPGVLDRAARLAAGVAGIAGGQPGGERTKL